jgi:hypothetical protein
MSQSKTDEIFRPPTQTNPPAPRGRGRRGGKPAISAKGTSPRTNTCSNPGGNVKQQLATVQRGSSASPNLQPWTIGTHIQRRASGGLVGFSTCHARRECLVGKRGRRELRDMAAGTPSISPALHSHFIHCPKGTERSRWVSFLRGTHKTKRQAPSRQVTSRQGRRENKCSDSFLPP